MLSRSSTLRQLRLSRPVRQLHAGPRMRYAAPSGMPNLDEIMANPRAREMFEKVGKHPAALEAVFALSEVFKRHGIDPSSGTRPGMIAMGKLLMDKEFREASQKLKEEMEKAGIDTTADLGGFSSMMGKKE